VGEGWFLPEGFAGVADDAALALFLASIDREKLDGPSRVHLMKARGKLVSQVQAAFLQDVLSVAHAQVAISGWEGWEFCSDEIRAAMHLTRRAADATLGVAIQVWDRLPQVGQALAAGDIDLARAKVICEELSHLDIEEARVVADTVLALAPELTTGQIRVRTRRLCVSVDPEEAAKRYGLGLDGRRLVLESSPDGTATILGIGLPADRAAEAMNRLHSLAEAARLAGDERTADQVRADVFLDVLTGRNPSQVGTSGVAHIRVGLETLMHLNEEAGDLSGFGPVVADIARQVAAHASTWEVEVAEGTFPVWTGTTRRRPNASTARRVRAREPVCVFPGCRMPAIDSDLDHRDPWTDSHLTTEGNLEPLCRHDHRLKHEGGWKVESVGNTYQWTSPLGQKYMTTRLPP
jgi:hypothetical protein